MPGVGPQLAGKPALWLPPCLVVAGSMFVGSRLAHSPDGGLYAGGLMVTQSVLTAIVMVIVLRAERSAGRAVAAPEQARTGARPGAARREDERAQLRMVHNGPLTILTMAFHASAKQPSAILRQRASESLDTLRHMITAAGPSEGNTRLDERLAKVTAWYQALEVTVDLQPCL